MNFDVRIDTTAAKWLRRERDLVSLTNRSPRGSELRSMIRCRGATPTRRDDGGLVRRTGAARQPQFPPRRVGSSNADDRSIREYYTMPFRKIVQASQNGAVMSSYNEINGVPSAANTYLNDTLMRETFGLQGYFTGDCDAVNQVNTRHHWQPDGFGHIATVVEQFAFTLASGEDAECNAGYSGSGSGSYRGPTAPSTTQGGLMNALGMHVPTQTGQATVNDLDVSATRLFTNRMKLGEFNPDSTVPWLTQAQARVRSYGVYPWVSSAATTGPPVAFDYFRVAGG
jgi:beta-glucosidase